MDERCLDDRMDGSIGIDFENIKGVIFGCVFCSSGFGLALVHFLAHASVIHFTLGQVIDLNIVWLEV